MSQDDSPPDSKGAPGEVQPPAQAVVTPGLGSPPFVLPAPGAVGVGQVAMQVWQSQYPPPEAVERYEAILPGAFDRILTMVENGQRHQIATVTLINRNLQSDTKRGAWLGFLVAIAGVGAAAYCAAIGQPWVAGACVSLPVLGLAKALVETGGGKISSATNRPSKGADQQTTTSSHHTDGE